MTLQPYLCMFVVLMSIPFMKRKDFLRMTTAAAAACLINATPFRAFGKDDEERVLILLHLKGGNDGLNTVIPIDGYDELAAVRKDILINAKDVLKLNDATGLHSGMSAMRDLYEDGMVKIVQGVGIHAPVFSHAAATKLWLDCFGAHEQQRVHNSTLDAQLQYVAHRVAKGEKQRTYIVTLDGFDTHVQQADKQALLLQQFSDATAAFMQQCKQLRIEDKITLVAFSEFGRRIKSNTYAGTDHGTAQPVFVIGKHVKGGIIGDNPTHTQADNNLPMQFDCRDILSLI